MTGRDPEAIAERVVEMVAGRAEAAATVTRTTQGLTRFANSFIHQNMVDEHTEVFLQLSAGGRPASASTFRTEDDKDLETLVERTLAAAALRPVDPAWPGLASPSPPVDGYGHFDQVTAAAGPAERAEVVAAFVAAGEGTEAAGFCETSVSERAFLNSAGQRLAERSTAAAIDAIHRRDGADGLASRYGCRLGELDGSALGARAAERCRLAADPVELPAGRYEVVLEPRSVAYLLDFFAFYGFNGRAVNEGRSFVSLGEAQLDPSISMWDDSTDARQVGPAFDAEGTPKRRVPMVDAGVVTGIIHDRRTAALAGGGAGSTGHAIAGAEQYGAIATNMFVAGAEGADGAGGAAPRPADSLVAGVETGLLVCDFWYTRVLDPKTLVATGLTRNGVFLIEGGRLGASVSNLRFTQSYAAALGPGNVLGVGDDAVLAPSGLHIGLHHAPTLRLASWSFTGNASA